MADRKVNLSFEIALLGLLAVLWGSSYLLIKNAVGWARHRRCGVGCDRHQRAAAEDMRWSVTMISTLPWGNRLSWRP